MKKSKIHLTETQVQMSNVAEEMATYFASQNITAGPLSEWVADANINLDDADYKTGGDARSILYAIGGKFLPGLIDCKTNEKRIKFFETGLIDIFDTATYPDIKKALAEIGVAYLQNFARLTNHPHRIAEFMSIYSAFLYMAELFGDYAYCQQNEIGSSN